jgi:hypothetical protein
VLEVLPTRPGLLELVPPEWLVEQRFWSFMVASNERNCAVEEQTLTRLTRALRGEMADERASEPQRESAKAAPMQRAQLVSGVLSLV